MLFEDGELAMRLMHCDDRDVALLARRLRVERLFEFYEGRDHAVDGDKVRELPAHEPHPGAMRDNWPMVSAP